MSFAAFLLMLCSFAAFDLRALPVQSPQLRMRNQRIRNLRYCGGLHFCLSADRFALATDRFALATYASFDRRPTLPVNAAKGK